MAQDDQTTASLAAKLRAEIRADIEAGLRIPRPAVPPITPPVTQPQAWSTGVGGRTSSTIPATSGRPELTLPPGALPALTLPSALVPGLVVSYARSDAMQGESLIPDTVSEFLMAHVNAANATIVSFDIRRYAATDPKALRPVSVGSLAVVGNDVSAGLYWIHPALLALLVGTSAPKQANGVTVERVTQARDGATVDAVKVAEKHGETSFVTIYELETGLLLEYESRQPEHLSMCSRYRSRRQLALPWAKYPLPAWVAITRQLVYEGGNTISLLGTSIRQTVVLTVDIQPPAGGVAGAEFTAVSSLGMGAPEERNSWDMACASPMLYPLWIAPDALRAMRPSERIDTDPLTGFTMTFKGIENGYGVVVEEGPLERVSYYFSVEDGLFAGFRGERPYGAIAGARAQTETWLRSRT